jgi:hypothetical protein
MARAFVSARQPWTCGSGVSIENVAGKTHTAACWACRTLSNTGAYRAENAWSSTAETVAGAFGGKEKLEEQSRAMGGEAGLARALGELNRVYAEVLKLIPPAPGQPTRDLPGGLEQLARTARPPVAKLVMPSKQMALSSGVHRAELRAALAVATMRLWTLRHTSTPPGLSLVTLAKEAGLASPPIDPYSGEPLKLAMVNKRLVVYSIGPDGRDDGGQVDCERGKNPTGDLIFPVSPENSP